MNFSRNTRKATIPTIAALIAISASAADAKAQFMTIPFIVPRLPSVPYGVTPPPPTTTKTHEKEGEYRRNYGNSWLGCGGYAMGKIKYVETTNHQDDTALAELLLRGHVNFLKRRPQVAKIHAKAVSKGQTGAVKNEVSLKIYLSDLLVINKKGTSGVGLYNLKKTLKLFPQDIRVKYPIGPVSITIKGNVGGSYQAGFTLGVNSRSVGARLDGDAKAWAFGTADASAGFTGAKVGLTAEAKFANQHLNINAGSNQRNKLSGGMTATNQAISLVLKAYLEIGYRWFKSKWSRQIADYHTNANTVKLF